MNGEKKHFGLYGARVDSTVMIDTGIHDPKSTWWRGEKIFLGQAAYKQEVDGKLYTISEYFDSLKEKADKQYSRSHVGEEEQYESESQGARRGNLRKRFLSYHKKHHEVGHAFNHDLQHSGFLERQRLFLGVLLRRPDLDKDSKEILWRTTAKLLPSRISALMSPFSMQEVRGVVARDQDESEENYESRVQSAWDSTMRKLAIIEHERVREDAEGFRRNPDGSRVRPDYAGYGLDHYIEAFNQRIENMIQSEQEEAIRNNLRAKQLTDQERAIVHRWQALGERSAKQLAAVIAPHAIFLDDVPITAWNLMGRTDLDRVLVGDQSGFAEAYSAVIGVIANPAIQYEKALEPMHGFVHTVQNILSLTEAQELVEPFLVSYIEMARKYSVSKFIPGRGLLRKADSEIEEFNPEANIQYETDELFGILAIAAQQEIVSDDPTEISQDMPRFEATRKILKTPGVKQLTKAPVIKQMLYKGETPFLRLRRRLKLDLRNLYDEKLGMLALIFGPMLATAILKAILPEEVEKNI